MSQYAHTAWKIREGFPKAYLFSIAQTPDGYLWLGSVSGLFRFDGVRAIPWEALAGEGLPSPDIHKLLAARNGRLWIGTHKGLVSWKDDQLTRYPELDGLAVAGLLEDREGTIWAGGQAFNAGAGRICTIRVEGTRCFGEDGSLGEGVFGLYEDRRGTVWALGHGGVWQWKPGPPKHYSIRGPITLAEDDDGAMLVNSNRGGITRIVDGKEQAYALPGAGAAGHSTVVRMLRDHNGALWIGTLERGLLHVHGGKTDAFARADGLSGDWITTLFEDREGNIWVGTIDGFDRFRDVPIPTISTKEGLSNGVVRSVLAARDGSVWLATASGLNRWKDGRIETYFKWNGLPDNDIVSLFQDRQEMIWVATRTGLAYYEKGRFVAVADVPSEWVHSIAEDGAGDIWVGQLSELVRLVQGAVAQKLAWGALSKMGYGSVLCFDPKGGGLWMGFVEGGVAYFKDGQLRSTLTQADGLGAGPVSALRLDAEGALWVSTENGLSRVKDGRVSTLTTSGGLPCNKVHWMMEDDNGSAWLYMACGLIRIERKYLKAWVRDPAQTVRVAIFDASDGVRSNPYDFLADPAVATTADGKLWFLPGDGVSVLDPRHLALNKLPPPVHVEQITADRRIYKASQGLRLPPLIRDLQIDYTALSLVAPEKVQFRYKLEGRDRDWQAAGTRRQAFYSDLSPGSYRFRVIACNNSGVWNEQGASLDFAIAPAYWQTNEFRALCAIAFIALLWLAYWLRTRQLARRFNLTLEARVSERTRIARELHDTLLQSFHGLLLRFQAISNQLQSGSIKEQLDSAIEDGAEAITEGRDAVQGLRASVLETNDLALALKTAGEELAADPAVGNSVGFAVIVEGAPRTLHPILRDEIYRIGCEALRNAFRHAQPKRIDLELRYDERRFGLRVRDDGKGIDPKFLSGKGRVGHFGLHGMRERAKLIGGKLSVWGAMGLGTEVELTIPAARAYTGSRAESS